VQTKQCQINYYFYPIIDDGKIIPMNGGAFPRRGNIPPTGGMDVNIVNVIQIAVQI
jgi:hypothetical protein